MSKLHSFFSKFGDYIRNMQLMRFLVFGFLLVVVSGTILLSLPFASKAPGGEPLNNCLFTATTSTCVTGLVLTDVFSTWTLFGQLVILVLIQIGGVGFMSIAIFALSLTKHKIGLKQRFTMQESVGAHQVAGVVKMAHFLLLASIAIEMAGALLLAIRFIPKFGILRGIYFSIFHAVSAFCNAGIDLMGAEIPGSSVTTMSDDWLVCGVIMALIILGGLGFLVWQDIIDHKFHFKVYKLQTKIVLVTSALLIVIGAVSLFVLESNSSVYDGMSVPEKILSSLFQSVSARTAGFESVDLTKMTETGKFVMIVLMFIGGSSGSTAGGIKTTTFAVLFISIHCVFRRRKSIECFRRRIDDSVLHNACCVMMIYLALSTVGAILISSIEQIPLLSAMFECVSAIATVGLSLGVTPTLSIASQLIIVAMMFIGRIGGITVLLAFGNRMSSPNSQYPSERLTVG